jgi:1-acyl-sn-glycerol-3-phosphate acyltransferase
MSAVADVTIANYGPLRRAWQLAGAALSFAVFGFGGVCFACLVAPALNLTCTPSRRHRASQHLIGCLFRVFIRLMRGFGLLRYELRGVEGLRAPGQIIVANHPTLIDVVFLIAFAPRTVCVVKGALFRNPFTRAAVRAAGYLNSNLTDGVLPASAQRLQAGCNILVFPEGTRSLPGRLHRFRRGFANIALYAGAPIRPVAIRCTPPALNRCTPWYRLPPRRLHFEFCVYETIRPEAFETDAGRAIAARRLASHLQTGYAHWLDDSPP